MAVRTPELRATARRSLGVIAAALVCIGCTAPTAQVSQVSSAVPTTTAPARATPTTPASTPSPAPEPAATPVPTFGFAAPDGILPPASIVVVLVDGLQLRGEPGLSAAVVGTAPAGSRFYVLHVFGPVVADGLDWYRLTTAGDSVLWAAAGSGTDQYLEVVHPDCPAVDPDLATLINMTNDWDRLACFGDRSLTLEGTYGCAGCGGTTGGDFEPMWLAFPMNFNLLWADYRANFGPLELRVPPDSGLEFPVQGSIVRVTGHFNDPASMTCSMSTFDGEQATLVDPRTADLYCRERFVVDAFEVIGTDPTFP